MKYETEIDGQLLTLDVEEHEGHAVAQVEDRRYVLDVVRPEPGVLLLFADDFVYELRVANPEAGITRVSLRERRFSVRVIDRKHRRPDADHGPEGRQHLIAPMPGKVVRILVNLGDEVQSGQGVVVVEAMKMQNEVKSVKHGHVVEIRVTEGVTVNANQVLAVVE